MSKLADLFKVGKTHMLEVSVGGQDYEFEIWLRKPTVEQQGRARTKANATSVRTKRPYKDKESEEYASLWASIEDESRDDLIKTLIETERSTARQAAYHEVLHKEDVGSDWSEEGLDYQGVLAAMAQRFIEIATHNDSDPEDIINPGEDEELEKLRVINEQFDEEWAEHTERMLGVFARRFEDIPLDDLQRQVVNKAVELEGMVAFHTEYRMNMLYYACRNPEDKQKLFFDSKEEILELPLNIQVELLDELEALLSADPKA